MLARLIEMIGVNMRVTQRVDELSRLQSRDLRDHHRQQCVGRNIKRYAQEYISRALIELARLPSAT